jgi:hypothetical protein
MLSEDVADELSRALSDSFVAKPHLKVGQKWKTKAARIEWMNFLSFGAAGVFNTGDPRQTG